jgi:Transposase DNA-binding
MSDLIEATSWAVTECADAELGDLRRTQRLVALAPTLAQRPGAALPEACGNGAMLQAAYRFFTNDDLAPDDMLQSPIEATESRLNAVPIVLAVQETTEAHWTHWRVTEG